MKEIIRKGTAVLAVAAMTVSAMATAQAVHPVETASAAAKNTAKVVDVDYQKSGVVDAEFKEDVKYKKARVTVKDNKGKTYGTKILHKDSDDIEFKIKKFKKGRTYKFTVKGVKDQDASKYAKATGKVVIPKNTVKASQRIGKAEAKAIALKDAGITEAQAKYLHVQFDYDDGRAIYEVDFVSGNKEYEYDIAAKTGRIVDKDIERFDEYDDDYYDEYDDDYYEEMAERKAAKKAKKASYIGVAKAKSIALKDAGLSAGSVKFMQAHLDYDDGYAIYEVDFRKGWMEYEYDIDAKTGEILEKDAEYDD